MSEQKKLIFYSLTDVLMLMLTLDGVITNRTKYHMTKVHVMFHVMFFKII